MKRLFQVCPGCHARVKASDLGDHQQDCPATRSRDSSTRAPRLSLEARMALIPMSKEKRKKLKAQKKRPGPRKASSVWTVSSPTGGQSGYTRKIKRHP